MDDYRGWPSEGTWAVGVGDPDDDEHEIVPLRVFFGQGGGGVLIMQFGERRYLVRPDDFFAAMEPAEPPQLGPN